MTTVPTESSEEQDYYEILGISKDVDQDAIKKAYRKQALKWHPDRNPDNTDTATERFKLIAQAYEVLKDPKKRKAYDSGGSAQFMEDFAEFTHFDPFNIFQSFFKDSGFDMNFDPFNMNMGMGNMGMGMGNMGMGNMGMGNMGMGSMGMGNMGMGNMNMGMGMGGFNNFTSLSNFGNMGGSSITTSTSTSTSTRGGGNGVTTVRVSSSSNIGGFGGGTGNSNVMSQSMSTSYVNGQKITIKKITKNGQSIEETYKNDQLIKKLVNGQPSQMSAIDYSSNNNVQTQQSQPQQQTNSSSSNENRNRRRSSSGSHRQRSQQTQIQQPEQTQQTQNQYIYGQRSGQQAQQQTQPEQTQSQNPYVYGQSTQHQQYMYENIP